MPKIPYSEKLKDPRWQKKRLEVFERDGWKCLYCGSSTKTLHVHHEVYHEEPWDAPFETLATMCSDCHNRLSFAITLCRKFCPTHKINFQSTLFLFDHSVRKANEFEGPDGIFWPEALELYFEFALKFSDRFGVLPWSDGE